MSPATLSRQMNVKHARGCGNVYGTVDVAAPLTPHSVSLCACVLSLRLPGMYESMYVCVAGSRMARKKRRENPLKKHVESKLKQEFLQVNKEQGTAVAKSCQGAELCQLLTS